MRSPLPALLLLALAASPAAAAERLLVVELFTSQGCSSCPPADALLAELARTDATLLPLGLHVTYWDRLGWKDPFSLPQATERQRRYSAQLGLEGVYTPQMVIGGQHQAIGSDRAAVRAALAEARRDARSVPLTLATDPAGLRIQAGAASGAGAANGAGAASGAGTLYLVGFDAQHATKVQAGENGGRTLPEANVVRSFAAAGPWRGAALSVALPRPPGERVAVLLQADDGRILGAATLP